MSRELALLKLSESLSKGYLAKNVITIILKIRKEQNEVALTTPERVFLKELKGSFEAYSRLPADAFSFTINDSLVGRETPRPFTESFVKELTNEKLEEFRSFSNTLDKIVNAKRPEDEELDALKDYFRTLLDEVLSHAASIRTVPDITTPMLN